MPWTAQAWLVHLARELPGWFVWRARGGWYAVRVSPEQRDELTAETAATLPGKVGPILTAQLLRARCRTIDCRDAPPPP